MNPKQSKTLRVLIALVVVLAIALAVVISVKNHKSSAASSAETSSSASSAEVQLNLTAITYHNGTATLSFAKDESGRWYWADDPDFPLDETALTQLSDTIVTFTPQQTITDGDALEDYGLDSPAITLTATADDGTTLTFALGNQVAGDSGSYYLLMNGDETTVYVAAPVLHNLLSASIYSMMQLPELPVLQEAQISTIHVAGAQDTLLSATVIQESAAPDSSAGSAETTQTVTWRSGGGNVTDNTDAQALISAVEALTLSACEDYKPSDKAVSLCGFDAPRAVVTVEYTDNDGQAQTFVLTVGATLSDGGSCYVRLADDTTVYSMSADTLKAILTVADSGLSA